MDISLDNVAESLRQAPEFTTDSPQENFLRAHAHVADNFPHSHPLSLWISRSSESGAYFLHIATPIFASTPPHKACEEGEISVPEHAEASEGPFTATLHVALAQEADHLPMGSLRVYDDILHLHEAILLTPTHLKHLPALCSYLVKGALFLENHAAGKVHAESLTSSPHTQQAHDTEEQK